MYLMQVATPVLPVLLALTDVYIPNQLEDFESGAHENGNFHLDGNWTSGESGTTFYGEHCSCQWTIADRNRFANFPADFGSTIEQVERDGANLTIFSPFSIGRQSTEGSLVHRAGTLFCVRSTKSKECRQA